MKIKELKSRLKDLASYNRQYKIKHKECQRGNLKWEELWASSRTAPSGDYRHLHIAYCLLRGRKYEQIENKVRPGNEPNWTRIESIMQEYHEVEEIACAEVICG